MNTSQKKGTVFVIDLCTEHLAKAIHNAGFLAGSLVLWQDRLTYSPWAIQANGYDVALRQSPSDSLDKLEAETRKASSHIAGIISTNEPTEEIAARLAKRLNVPHNNPDVAAIRWHKAKIKDHVAKAGLRVPKAKMCYSDQDILDFIKDLSFPVIIKTPAGSASVNVFRCNDTESLIKNHEIITSTSDDFGNTPDHSVVEEYISGRLFEVNTFSDGKSVRVTDAWFTEKIDTDYADNLFYNLWLISPHDPSVKAVVEYTEEVARANEILYGPGHFEIIVDEKGPALIEAHARTGGFNEPVSVQEFSNFDPFQAEAEVFSAGTTQIPPEITFEANMAVAACPATVRLEEGRAIGIDEIRRLPSYSYDRFQWGQAWGPVHPTIDMRNIPFTVWLTNKDQNQLKKDVRRVHTLFHFELSRK